MTELDLLPTAERPRLVVAVQTALCAVPLPRPIRLGTVEYTEREYAVIRVDTGDGLTGWALGYTRGLPVMDVLERLAPELVGCDPARREELVASVASGSADATGAAVRARGLIEIALWDLAARAAGLPLWRLLGGVRERVELLAVAGYFLEERGLADVEAEVRELVAQGFRHVKVHAVDPQTVARLLAACGGEASFAIDVHTAWSTLPEALAVCRPLDELGLAFIEDPFPPDRWRLTAELGSRLRTPVAAGEDAAGPDALRRLADAVSVLRVDATASGGIAPVLEATALASARGCSVMTHAFPDFHAHLGGGVAAIGLVEMIPYGSGANPVDVLMARPQRVGGGQLFLSEAPGHGMELDPEAVARFARRITAYDIDVPNGRITCS